MSAPERVVLLCRVLGCTIATSVVRGLRCLPLESLVPSDDADLPLRGVLRPGLPLVDLAYLLAGVPGEGTVALELPVGRTRLAFLVEATLDIVTLARPPAPLPALLRAAVRYPDCWQALPYEGAVLPLLDLARVLAPAAAEELQRQAAALVAARDSRA
ncbi:MAG: hypothetical protein IRZ14_16365 [Chloroflexi bacterium]|nr:hypothetical protein [Chloroflexota bacterium]